ncbi:MAG: tetratricopeptide repeat protein [Planctomycetota bacterium]
MRIVITVVGLSAALLCQPATSAPPVFGGSSQNSPAPANSGWGLPKFGQLLGLKSAKQNVTTPAIGANPLAQQQPTATQQFTQALTNNRFTAAMQAATTPAATTAAPDALSLNQPVQTPGDNLLLPMAAMAEQSGDIEAARGLLQRCLAADPTNVETLRKYGRLEDRQGRLEEAEKLYQQAVASNPEHAGASNDLGLCLARQSKLDESLAALERAIVLAPAKTLYRNNVAKVLVETGDTPRAIAHLAAVHGPVIAHFNVGQMLAAAGNAEEATLYLNRALAMDPGFEPARVSLAKIDGPVATPAAPQLATRPNLPALPAASLQPSQPAPPAATDLQELPALPTAGSAATAAGPSFPRLLPPVTN